LTLLVTANSLVPFHSLKNVLLSFISPKFTTSCKWTLKVDFFFILEYPCKLLHKVSSFVSKFWILAISLSFVAVMFSFVHLLFPSLQFYPLPRGQILFLVGFFISLSNIKPLFPINKQLGIDSFLDWEGHHQATFAIFKIY